MAPRTANIFFKDEPAGILVETTAGGTRFTYGADWPLSIGCALPVERREHEWLNGLHPFFQHLAPEGWLRHKQAADARIAEEDDFGLLLKFGADCIGAVSLKPVEDVALADEFRQMHTNPGRSVSGIQKKLLVLKNAEGIFEPAGPKGSAPYIAKFNSENIPTLVRNEALSLKWTSAVLGTSEVTQFGIAKISNINEIALVVTQFDRTSEGKKLRLEDCAQILSKPRGQDYSGKYEGAYEDIAEIIKAHSSRPQIDLANFFRRLVAFILVGNCDGHLKNFSMLETASGLRLSPAYDIINTAIYPELDQKLALTINGAHLHLDEITQETLRNFGLSVGIPQKAINEALSDLTRKAKAANGQELTPPDGEDPEGFVTRFGEIVERACRRILPS